MDFLQRCVPKGRQRAASSNMALGTCCYGDGMRDDHGVIVTAVQQTSNCCDIHRTVAVDSLDLVHLRLASDLW